MAKLPRSQREFGSKRELELQHWFIVLINSLRFDRETGKSTLRDRFEVSRDLFGDLHYCKGLRNRYAHLTGLGEPVSTLQQLSDLVVVHRVIVAVSPLDPAIGRNLTNRISTLTKELSADAASIVSPELDRDDLGVHLHEDDKTELSSLIVQAVRQSVVPIGTEPISDPVAPEAIFRLLNDIRADVSRITEQGIALAELARTVDRLRQAVDQEHARSVSMEEVLQAPSEPRDVQEMPFPEESEDSDEELDEDSDDSL